MGVGFRAAVIAACVSRTLERVTPPLAASRVVCNLCSLVDDMTRAYRSKEVEGANYLLEGDNPCRFARYWVDAMSGHRAANWGFPKL
jgi:hypothetical protein